MNHLTCDGIVLSTAACIEVVDNGRRIKIEVLPQALDKLLREAMENKEYNLPKSESIEFGMTENGNKSYIIPWKQVESGEAMEALFRACERKGINCTTNLAELIKKINKIIENRNWYIDMSNKFPGQTISQKYMYTQFIPIGTEYKTAARLCELEIRCMIIEFTNNNKLVLDGIE